MRPVHLPFVLGLAAVRVENRADRVGISSLETTIRAEAEVQFVFVRQVPVHPGCDDVLVTQRASVGVKLLGARQTTALVGAAVCAIGCAVAAECRELRSE